MNSAIQARPSGRRQDPARGPAMAQRPHHQRGSVSQARRLSAPTWLHYRLDLVEGQSDAPRIPPHQIARLHPAGAPRSWELLVLQPPQPSNRQAGNGPDRRSPGRSGPRLGDRSGLGGDDPGRCRGVPCCRRAPRRSPRHPERPRRCRPSLVAADNRSPADPMVLAGRSLGGIS